MRKNYKERSKKTKMVIEGICPNCKEELEKGPLMGHVLILKCRSCGIEYLREPPYGIEVWRK